MHSRMPLRRRPRATRGLINKRGTPLTSADIVSAKKQLPWNDSPGLQCDRVKLFLSLAVVEYIIFGEGWPDLGQLGQETSQHLALTIRHLALGIQCLAHLGGKYYILLSLKHHDSRDPTQTISNLVCNRPYMMSSTEKIREQISSYWIYRDGTTHKREIPDVLSCGAASLHPVLNLHLLRFLPPTFGCT